MAFLQTIYKKFYETLEFKAIQDLYTLFLPFDFRKDKKFDDKQLKQIFAKRNITLQEPQLKFLFEEYDIEMAGFVKYSEIEKDYRELTEEERKRGNFNRDANLPQILEIM